jgi:tRNA-dihydrouridine synthase
MLGRGLIANPALARELCCGAPLQKEELRQFHDAVYKELKETLPGQAVLIGKMKELWFYMGRNFADADRFLKEIRKAKNEIQYRSAVRVLFANCPFPASGHTEANVGE